ncbi:MAG: four helix bundle protein [Verrucomicrobia bacterium]|nr:four helix bundle protein [Verrucomicrobiota bacterium]
MSIRTFEDLECWKKCRELRLFVAKQAVPSLPKDERYRLGDQMLRAARSTTANIAEGYGRFHFLDNAKFCSNSRGSCWEVLDHLVTGQDDGLLSREYLDHGRQLVADAVKVLNGYLHYLQKAAQTRHEAPGDPEVPPVPPTEPDTTSPDN